MGFENGYKLGQSPHHVLNLVQLATAEPQLGIALARQLKQDKAILGIFDEGRHMTVHNHTLLTFVRTKLRASSPSSTSSACQGNKVFCSGGSAWVWVRI